MSVEGVPTPRPIDPRNTRPVPPPAPRSYDMRTIQAVLSRTERRGADGVHPQGRFYDYQSDREELWLDFMADCGDGFNSSYEIARLLAQPALRCVAPGTRGPARG